MHTVTADLPPPVNHVFIDFENVREVDLAVIGSKTAAFVFLVGPRQMKLDVSLVEKLFEHAVSVQLVRLTSAGRNALDFPLAYYVGRAVAADPTGVFHIVSKDAGYDPLVQHLRTRHIHVWRHDSFAGLMLAVPPGTPTPLPSTAACQAEPQTKPKSELSRLGEWETRVLKHFRRPSVTRPRSQKTLVRFLVAYLGHKITETDALSLIEALSQAGHLVVGEKGTITYTLDAPLLDPSLKNV